MSNQVSSPPAIVQFQFQQHQIRALTIDGEPWFVAKDVYKALGLAWNSETRRAIPKRWRGRTEDHRRIISEAAVYKLAFRANKPEAGAFVKWMEAEVLPALRADGEAVPVSVSRGNTDGPGKSICGVQEGGGTSGEAVAAERLDKVGVILDNELYPLAERTASLADILTGLMEQEGSAIHLAFQLEENTKEISRLVYEALMAG